jgi:hypothetical protein
MYESFQKVNIEENSFLEASYVNYLLANTEQIPEDWKQFTLQFWGTIFRVDQKYRKAIPMIIEMFWEELLGIWTVRQEDLGTYMSNDPILKDLVTALQDDTSIRVLFV